jgi:AAA+ ATPase superfamily predicted ATPase
MQKTLTAGFIAQELDEVQTKEKAGWLNLVLKNNPDKLEATPGNLLPVMVKAIQELKAENNELKDKLDKFERMQSVLISEIEKLKSKEVEVTQVKDGN